MAGQGGVAARLVAELALLGPTAEGSTEAQVALSLAAVLDDRIGMQNGGSAATAKQFLATLDLIRERYAKPEGKSNLELLRGGRTA